ncbi:unnamed protein product [Amoebophrya sp. A120]|nr:unnamed protein product [Amoebophrya sp. A120]|eukprot:GSA120T00019408001.1
MNFGGGDSSGAGAGASAAQQQQALMQMQILQVQKLQCKILGNCFSKCVSDMRAELSNGEQNCIYQCTHRLFDSQLFLEKRLVSLGQKVQASG